MKKILVMLFAIVMIMSFVACSADTFEWSTVTLGDYLPVPPSQNGKIHSNYEDQMWVEVSSLSDEQYNKYIEACKEKGFTIDAESTSGSYTAYNSEGYKLSLSHYGADSDMSISLEAPMEMSEITWPTGSAGNQLPAPKSLIGKFNYENEDNFYVFIGNTPRSDYEEYITACSEKGFSVDYTKGDNNYSAKNNEGWLVKIRYEGNNVMSVYIKGPSKDTETEPPVTETSGNSEELGTEFKAAMDSYEKFMDEYVAFMKKYKANPSDITLIGDYASFMTNYSKYVADFSKWESAELNAAETAYYIDVQARVSKKLLEVAN